MRAGHAFEGRLSSTCHADSEYGISDHGDRRDPFHEHGAFYPWMKDFFGEKADDYCYAHLAEALVKIPYMVAVDEFQAPGV